MVFLLPRTQTENDLLLVMNLMISPAENAGYVLPGRLGSTVP